MKSVFSTQQLVFNISDENIMKKSGQILLTTDLAEEYNFEDVDGNFVTFAQFSF